MEVRRSLRVSLITIKTICISIGDFFNMRHLKAFFSVSNALARFMFAGFVIVSLTNCTAVPSVNIARTADQFRTDPRNDALLVVSTVVNTGEVSQVANLRLQRLDAPLVRGKPNPAPPEFLLTTVNTGKSKNISLLVGSVPAGRYKVIELSFGGKYLNLRTNEGLNELNITAKETYDLGMIILTAANTSVLIGRSQRFTDNKDFIARYIPNNEALKNAHSGGWIEPETKKEPLAEYFAVTHPQGIGHLVENSNGEILAGTRMGTIAARSTAGKWRVIGRTDTYDQVTLVTPNPNGSKDSSLAFTENGDAYLVENNKTSKLNTGNLPSGQVFFMQTNPQATRWFAGVTHDNRSELLTATSLDGKWETLYSENIEFSQWSGARNVWTAKLPNGFVFASSNSPDIRCYDFSTEKWTLSNIPRKRTLLDLRANGKTGAIGILTGPGGGFAGAFATPLLSTQCGANWVEIKNPYTVQVAAPIPFNDASIAAIGGVFGDTGMYVSTDSGKTWQKKTNQTVLSDRFYQSEHNGLFLVSNGANGWEVVSNSKDNGATWATELSSFDQRLK